MDGVDKLFQLLGRIDSKVDKLSVDLAKQQVHTLTHAEELRKIRDDLNYHIKRTDLLEKEFTKLRGFLFYTSLAIGAIGAVTTILSDIWKFAGR
jgi:hypothetical protein